MCCLSEDLPRVLSLISLLVIVVVGRVGCGGDGE